VPVRVAVELDRQVEGLAGRTLGGRESPPLPIPALPNLQQVDEVDQAVLGGRMVFSEHVTGERPGLSQQGLGSFEVPILGVKNAEDVRRPDEFPAPLAEECAALLQRPPRRVERICRQPLGEKPLRRLLRVVKIDQPPALVACHTLQSIHVDQRQASIVGSPVSVSKELRRHLEDQPARCTSSGEILALFVKLGQLFGDPDHLLRRFTRGLAGQDQRLLDEGDSVRRSSLSP